MSAASFSSMTPVELASGEAVAVLGQGTWAIGDDPRQRREEIAALQLGIELGMTLVDTAEMYGDGKSEELVGEAIRGRRDQTFIVSKVLPDHASKKGTIAACEASLRRLGTDRLDLYLLHWRGAKPLAGTVEAFETLRQAGKIRHWGVSNFDLAGMIEVSNLSVGIHVQTNQVLYNLTRRGIERDLIPWCRERRIPIMAYSPIEQGRLLTSSVLHSIAQRHDATAAQVALAWVLKHPGILAIPKAGNRAHVRQNRAALELRLTHEDLLELDRAYPAPEQPQSLEMI